MNSVVFGDVSWAWVIFLRKSKIGIQRHYTISNASMTFLKNETNYNHVERDTTFILDQN